MYINHISFILSFTDRHLGCFHILAIVNNVDEHGRVSISFISFLFPLDKNRLLRWCRGNESTLPGDARDVGSISGSVRYSGVGNGNPFHYSSMENSMDRGAWWATVRGISKSQT